MDLLDFQPALPAPHVRPATVRITYRGAFDGHEDWALVEPGRTDTWVVVLHGHGSHGDQVFTRPDIATQWLPLLREHGLGILSPNLRDNAWMCPAAVADLHALLAWLHNQYPVERVLAASGSMGGTGNLIYAAQHPQDLAGVIAFCPATDIARYYGYCRRNPRRLSVVTEIGDAIAAAYGGTPDTVTEVYAAHSALDHAARLTMPVALCHGDRDAVIPVEESRTLVAKLRPHHQNVWYRELPKGHHDSPLQHYSEALEWLLEV